MRHQPAAYPAPSVGTPYAPCGAPRRQASSLRTEACCRDRAPGSAAPQICTWIFCPQAQRTQRWSPLCRVPTANAQVNEAQHCALAHTSGSQELAVVKLSLCRPGSGGGCAGVIPLPACAHSAHRKPPFRPALDILEISSAPATVLHINAQAFEDFAAYVTRACQCAWMSPSYLATLRVSMIK